MNALRLIASIAILCIFQSCHDFAEPDRYDNEADQEGIAHTITLNTSVKGSFSQTKSSVGDDADTIHDINLFVYKDGVLVSHKYESEPSKASLTLSNGHNYNLYALANMGRIEAPETEEGIKSLCYAVENGSFVSSVNRHGFPMAWNRDDVRISKDTESLEVGLSRLVSRIRFRIDKDALPGLEVTSATIHNAACVVSPFARNGHAGSRAESPSDVSDGDRACAADINLLNSGNEICFHVMENCQGSLLPGNTDPWKKVPSNLNNPGLCTYLEVKCEFAGGFILDGNITYRIYLGQDNRSNFDIIRNTDMCVRLCLSKDLENLSWKIDPDVRYNGSLCAATVAQGLHGTSEMYIGESLRLSLGINRYLEEFLGEGLEGYRIVCLKESKPCSSFSISGISYNGSSYSCDIKCLAEETGGGLSLWLESPKGKIITDLTLHDGSLRGFKPTLVVGDGSICRPGKTIVAPFEYPTPIINGNGARIHLYLTDKNGNNLNCSKAMGQYGFDPGVFQDLTTSSAASDDLKISMGLTAAGMAVQCLRMVLQRAGTMDGGPSHSVYIDVTNPGTDEATNRTLSRMISLQDENPGDNKLAIVSISGPKCVGTSRWVDIGYIKPYVFNGNSGSFPVGSGRTISGESFLAVHNPSMIDLHADLVYAGRRVASTSVPTTSGTRPVYYITSIEESGSSIPYYPTLADKSSADLRHTATNAQTISVDGKQCRLYSIDPVGGVAAMSTRDGKKAYTRMEVNICTAAGKFLDYYYTDLNSKYITSSGTITQDGLYRDAWDQYGHRYEGCGWYSGRDFGWAVKSNLTGMVATRTPGYNGSNIWRILDKSPVVFDLGWDETSGAARININGNHDNETFRFDVRLTLKSSCRAADNSSNSAREYTYTLSPFKTYSFESSSNATRVLLVDQNTIEEHFQTLNMNYWHEHCTSMINTSSNRFSSLALPQEVTISVNIFAKKEGKWIPVSPLTTVYSSKVSAKKEFYSQTAKGTYAEQNSRNPDNSSRGPDATASKLASKYRDYTAAAARYNVNFEYKGIETMNCYDM